MKNTAYILRLALTLLVITSMVALALAGVNAITASKIAGAKQEKIQAAIKEVLEGGGEKIPSSDPSGMITAVYKGDNGYAVEVNPSGFGGTITMMVGIKNDGTVNKISIISHAETPSLGAVAADKGSAGAEFRGRFAGLSGHIAVTKDSGTVDSIAGATVTSRAICEGVNAALAYVAGLG